MIPKHIIELAVKGGFKFPPNDFKYLPYPDVWQPLVLSPLFWQSLGKALGWEYTLGKLKIEGPDPVVRAEIAREWGVKPDWMIRAGQFFDLLLSGGDTVKFWEDITK